MNLAHLRTLEAISNVKKAVQRVQQRSDLQSDLSPGLGLLFLSGWSDTLLDFSDLTLPTKPNVIAKDILHYTVFTVWWGLRLDKFPSILWIKRLCMDSLECISPKWKPSEWPHRNIHRLCNETTTCMLMQRPSGLKWSALSVGLLRFAQGLKGCFSRTFQFSSVSYVSSYKHINPVCAKDESKSTCLITKLQKISFI